MLATSISYCRAWARTLGLPRVPSAPNEPVFKGLAFSLHTSFACPPHGLILGFFFFCWGEVLFAFVENQVLIATRMVMKSSFNINLVPIERCCPGSLGSWLIICSRDFVMFGDCVMCWIIRLQTVVAVKCRTFELIFDRSRHEQQSWHLTFRQA